MIKKLYSAAEMPSLIRLSVAHNHLIKIDFDFCEKASFLENLDLSYNNLTLDEHVKDEYWSKDLSNCTNLKVLNVRFNNISKIPYSERKNYNFSDRREFYLEFNKITKLNVSEINKLHKLI